MLYSLQVESFSVEHPKIKKLTSWLLYHSGAQPTEPPKGGWLLVDNTDDDRPSHAHLKEQTAPEYVAIPVPSTNRSVSFLRGKWQIISVAALLVFIVGWWAVGPVLAKAQFGDTKLSLGVSDKELVASLEDHVATYKLPVQYTDGTKQDFPMSEVGFTLDQKQSLRSLRSAQHSTLQRFTWWRPVQQPLEMQTSPRKMHAFIAEHVTKIVQPSQDAVLSITPDGSVAVADAVAGKQYGLDNPQINLLRHVSTLNQDALRIKTLTNNPAVTSQQLAGSKTKLEQVLNQPVAFDIGGKTVKPSKTDIASWLELTPNTKQKTVDVDINSGKVQQYISKIASANVHPARDQVEVTRNDGTVSVVVAGVNGVDVTNKDTVATEVADNLLAGKGISASLPVNTTPYKTVSTSAYPKWIEVDLTNKRMYTYEQTNLVRTFKVSAGAPKTPTVTGKFSIYSKYTQKDMRGNNVDGSKYFQPNVPWVNFFYKDYAIHGNYWRPTSYFGNINSSHGCVSTVTSDAAWIYDWAPIGTPVIVHT